MRKSINFLIVILALACLFTAVSCRKTDSETSSGDQLEQIRERGSIIVATEGTWAPWTFHDENDELVGYDGMGWTFCRPEFQSL